MFGFANIETNSRFIITTRVRGFKNIDSQNGFILIINALTLYKSGISIDIV